MGCSCGNFRNGNLRDSIGTVTVTNNTNTSVTLRGNANVGNRTINPGGSTSWGGQDHTDVEIDWGTLGGIVQQSGQISFSSSGGLAVDAGSSGWTQIQASCGSEQKGGTGPGQIQFACRGDLGNITVTFAGTAPPPLPPYAALVTVYNNTSGTISFLSSSGDKHVVASHSAPVVWTTSGRDLNYQVVFQSNKGAAVGTLAIGGTTGVTIARGPLGPGLSLQLDAKACAIQTGNSTTLSQNPTDPGNPATIISSNDFGQGGCVTIKYSEPSGLKGVRETNGCDCSF